MGLFGREDTPAPELRKPSPRRSGGDDRADAADAELSADLTVISEHLSIEGALDGGGQVVVHGRVRGKIESRGSVTVAAHGRVESSLHAATAVVSGRVVGAICATGLIELEATADVTGDLSAPRIVIRDGAKLTGRITMPGSGARRDPATSGETRNQPE